MLLLVSEVTLELTDTLSDEPPAADMTLDVTELFDSTTIVFEFDP